MNNGLGEVHHDQIGAGNMRRQGMKCLCYVSLCSLVLGLVHTCVRVYVCVHVYMCVSMYMYVCVCSSVYACLCGERSVGSFRRVCVLVYMYVCMSSIPTL